MIKHTVTFTLRHPSGSLEEKTFLEAGMALARIPTVKHFECLRQTSCKSSFTFGFSMDFNTEEDYQAYNDHKDHLAFVNNHWIPEVVDFLELDYTICEIVEQNDGDIPS